MLATRKWVLLFEFLKRQPPTDNDPSRWLSPADLHCHAGCHEPEAPVDRREYPFRLVAIRSVTSRAGSSADSDRFLTT